MSDLPKGWALATLHDICEIIQGQSPPGSSYNEDRRGLPFFQGKADFGVLHPTPRVWCDAPKKIAEPGNILISIRAPVGPTNIADRRSAIGRGLAVIRPSGGISTSFILHALRHLERSLEQQATGSTFSAISGQQLRRISIPLPPLPEQRRIVAEIEKQFTRLEEAVSALASNARRLGRLRAASAEKLFSSLNANIRPLGEIADVQGGIQKQPKRAPVRNHYPFLRVANVLRGRLDLREVHQIELFGEELEKLRLRKGDLLIVEGNGSPSEIGRMAIWDGSIPNCVHQNHIIRARLRAGILPEFAAAYWNSPRGAHSVRSVASSTSGLHTLSVSKVKAIPCPVLDPAKQSEFVSRIELIASNADALLRSALSCLTHAASLRQAILAKAFSGQLVPQDPNDEPASVLLERTRENRNEKKRKTKQSLIFA